MKKWEELYRKMTGFAVTYFLKDLHADREDFYALSDQELRAGEVWYCLSGKVLNLIMDGELKKARELIDSIPEDNPPHAVFLKLGLSLVHPEVKLCDFLKILDHLTQINIHLYSFILTAGRPFLLNGFNDFTRLGMLLPSGREIFLSRAKYIYPENFCPYIYNLCLAEYYYQQNRLTDAQLLASTTIKKFDIEGERRIMFSALFLRSKILVVEGKTVKSESFVKEIRSLVKNTGNAEFSYNIEATGVLFALYEGKNSRAAEWLKSDAPDEYEDFNMLDLFRYMIKMRCYILTKKYNSVIALAEKLRPLLEKGKRFMDLCEMDLLLAMSLYLSGNKEKAFEVFKRALKLVSMYRYYRAIADEGSVMLSLLLDYVKAYGKTDLLMRLVEMTRETSINSPLYLTEIKAGDRPFTKMERDILRLLEQGKTREEIAGMFFISINTVKFHLHNIYTKLGAEHPHQAVWQAKIKGII
jgi:LuxR family maltose regulon positive regulatory protein